MGSWAFSFGPYSDHPIPFEQIVERLCTFLERFAELPDRLETNRPLTEAASPTLEATS